jgi:tetratricopeptide (TPR) repeat protein
MRRHDSTDANRLRPRPESASPRRAALRLLAALALLALPSAAPAQDDVYSVRRGSLHLYGDLKVEGESAEARAPSFHIALYGNAGAHVGRQPVTVNGRYRFNNLPPGDYTIVVEMDGQEVSRTPVFLSAKGSDEVRQDISLAWGGGARVAGPAMARAPGYARAAANQSLYDRGREAARKKDYEQAADLFAKAAEADPQDHEAWAELGTARSKQEKLEEAERAYLRAAEAKPDFALAHLNLGRVRVMRKDFEGAALALTRAAELRPESAEAHLLLGEVHLQLKKGSKAVPHLQEAARLGKSEAHLRLATLYNAAGLKDRAAAEYEQFIAKEPNYPERKKLEEYVRQNKKP